MKTGLEEALAECLDSVESGDSIEECLARYPELARELEPLLLTALGLQQLFDVDPRPSFQRAARQRFLTAALRPRRPRLLVVPTPPRRFSFGWRWAPAAVGAPALAAAIALAVVMGLSDGGGGPEGRITVGVITPAPSATEPVPVPEPEEIDKLVARLEVQLDQMQEQVATVQSSRSETIQALKDINQSLEQTLPASPPEAAEAASQIAGLLDQQQTSLLNEATRAEPGGARGGGRCGRSHPHSGNYSRTAGSDGDANLDAYARVHARRLSPHPPPRRRRAPQRRQRRLPHPAPGRPAARPSSR